MYFYALLKGVKFSELATTISELLKDVDLLRERDMKSSELSGGMRRRLSLAIALIGNPKVVILDEPSSGLDPSHRRQMWDILLSTLSSI
jgi:ABC-type multidrug transport system ATPase subunit